MCVVTRSARLIGMRTDGMRGALRRDVAAHAHRRWRAVFRAEAVAVLTARPPDGVQRCHHRGVAARARLRRGSREADVAVAVGARDLADVRGMTRAVPHVEVRDRYLIGRAIAAAGAARDHDQQQRDDPHGRDPMG